MTGAVFLEVLLDWLHIHIIHLPLLHKKKPSAGPSLPSHLLPPFLLPAKYHFSAPLQKRHSLPPSPLHQLSSIKLMHTPQRQHPHQPHITKIRPLPRRPHPWTKQLFRPLPILPFPHHCPQLLEPVPIPSHLHTNPIPYSQLRQHQRRTARRP